MQLLEEPLQVAPFVLRDLLGRRFARDQNLQYWPDLLQGRDDVDGARGQRAWHLTELGGRGVLDDNRAPGLADGARALGAVCARAAQDDGYEVLSENPCRGLHEKVYGGHGLARRRLRTQFNLRVGYVHVPLAGTTKIVPA